MIYKYTSCESVIAKIMADLDQSEKGNRVTDMREWIFEAIEKIGAPMQYIQVETEPIQIEDHQVPIPDDLHDLNSLAWSPKPDGVWIPMRSNNAAFKEPHRQYTRPGAAGLPPMKHKLPTTQSEFFTNQGTLPLERALGDLHEPLYFIKPGWVVTNKAKGFIKMVYKAIATDNRGYPLIPDLASYQEAVYWYVVMKLKFPKYLNGSLGGHRKYAPSVYATITQNWNFYRNQAYAEAMMPTEGDIRSIKNEWTKLIPDWDSDDTFFQSSGQRQLNFNDYYYGY